MPGIATQFVILEQTIARLHAGNSKQQHVAGVMHDNLPFAYLGALGPALADFIPSDPPPPNTPSIGGTSPYTTLWKQIFAITGGDGTDADPGMFKILSTFRDFLAKIVPAAAAHDLGALKDLKNSGQLDAVVKMADLLKTLVDSFTPKVVTIGTAITAGMKPGVNVPVGKHIPNPVTWTAREWLFWKHPGRFATALVKRAQASNDPRFIAYSLGYLSSFAGNVAGSPFVNSIVGGAYRPQWWRHRWINNYVDTWVYGAHKSGATMMGDTPSMPYADWPGLCDAALHANIQLGPLDPVDVMARLRNGDPFPAVLPSDFADYWMRAWTDAYGAQLGRFQAKALNGAYVMTWMKLWFQTSGSVIGCNPAPPMTPPSHCDGNQPPWVDPFTAPPGDNGQGLAPPTPTFEHDPDVAETVTGIILAVLGVAAVCFGGGAAGAAAIAAGVGMIIDGELNFTWDKLNCDLYWYQHFLHNGVETLHNLTTLGAFTHEYPAKLAEDTTTINLLGAKIPFDSGKRVVRSQPRIVRAQAGEYPSKPWSGSLGTWPNAPTGADPGWEQELTTAYYVTAYPSFFVDDAANPVIPDGDVKTGGSWPPGFRVAPGKDSPVQVGNAVDNALDLIAHAGADLPDWNLDADRGMAALTWAFKDDTYTDPVSIVPEA